MKQLLMVAVVAVGLLALPAFAADKGDPDKGRQIAATVCAACHGADGNSVIPANPKLAGQHPAYIERQLRAFKSGERKNPVMAGMAAPLSDADIRNLAAWFGAQQIKRGQANGPELAARGRLLYRAGDAAARLPACAACHGPTGGGIPDLYPRLGGQNAEYTAAQLKAFRAGDRGDSGPGKAMQQVAAKLSDKDIDALSQYIAGLH